jgi:hypothetical protein
VSDMVSGQVPTETHAECYGKLRLLLDGIFARHSSEIAIPAFDRWHHGIMLERECDVELRGALEAFGKRYEEDGFGEYVQRALVHYRTVECSKWKQPQKVAFNAPPRLPQVHEVCA